MSVITFSKASDNGMLKGSWLASSCRVIGTTIYPLHPHPSVEFKEYEKLRPYFEIIFEKDSFVTYLQEVEDMLFYNRYIWGIRFKYEADEAAFILHVNDGIEI